MPVPNQTYLPTYDELTTTELTVSTPTLKAASLHMGKYCDNVSKEYMLCKKDYKNDPRPCINEGREVTRCGLEFLHQVKDKCYDVFTAYTECIDRKTNLRFEGYCRGLQQAMDECMKTKIGVSRPEIGYFSKTRLHETARPKPETLPAPLPDRYPAIEAGKRQPRAKNYGTSGFDL